MTRARNFADVISGNFAIPSGSLGNAVPADGSITTAKLADDAITSAKIADDAVTSAAIATNAVASDALNISSADLPSGTVLQCVTTNYSDDTTFSLNASSNAADNGKMHRVPGLDTSITPTSTSSRILYQATVYIGGNLLYDVGIHIIKNATSTVSTTTTNYTDTTPLGGSYLTDASGNAIRGQTSNTTPKGTGVINDHNSANFSASAEYRIVPISMSLLDHPNTTSQITYNFAIAWYAWENYALYMNRSHNNQQSTVGHYDTNPVSTVTLMEIA